MQLCTQNYIVNFVTHVNSYTGVAYKDDPTIIAWETGNELGGASSSRRICPTQASLTSRVLAIPCHALSQIPSSAIHSQNRLQQRRNVAALLVDQVYHPEYPHVRPPPLGHRRCVVRTPLVASAGRRRTDVHPYRCRHEWLLELCGVSALCSRVDTELSNRSDTTGATSAGLTLSGVDIVTDHGVSSRSTHSLSLKLY